LRFVLRVERGGQHAVELLVAVAHPLGLFERLRRFFPVARVEEARPEHEDHFAEWRLIRIRLERRGKGLCRAGVLLAIREPHPEVVQRVGGWLACQLRSHLRRRRAGALPAGRGICKPGRYGEGPQREHCNAARHCLPSFPNGLFTLFSALSLAFASRVASSATFTVMSSIASG